MILSSVLQTIDSTVEQSLERLFALLRIPSISTDPAYKNDCARAADWLVRELSGLGFAASARPTGGHPMVVAHYLKAGKAQPHVLFYAHYDVQPVDPLDLWETPPFEPRLVTGDGKPARIVARGAADDKGQLMTFVEACRAMIAATGSLPVNVTLLLEGEEECGSASLIPFLNAHKNELLADLALVCDTNMWNRETPAITMMLRGLVGEELEITASNQDLHSGKFGGVALNPIHVLTRILAELHDEEGRVTLPAFYEGVEEISPDLRRNWENLGFDEASFLQGVGLKHAIGEKNRSTLEKLWARPTAEVNGISGGYTGEGFKTVLPSKASAKVSFRLTGTMDPDRIRASFRKFVEERLPPDAKVRFISHGGNPALRLTLDNPAVAKSRAALEAEWGRPAAIIGSGGSIPIVGYFRDILGIDSLMVGFGLVDDRIHSLNEKYDFSSFHKGIRSWAHILDALVRR